jgi:hypothetical protein
MNIIAMDGRSPEHVKPKPTQGRWGFDAEPGPCAGCKFRSHCAGNVDAVTGVKRVAADTCDAYRAYSNRKTYQDKCQTPYRVRHASTYKKN